MIKIILTLSITPLISNTTLSLIITIPLSLLLLSFFITHYNSIFLSYSEISWDTLSFSLITLSVYILLLILIARISNRQVLQFNTLFTLTLSFLLISLVRAFRTTNLIIFYILFEASLIPTFILILGWGNQPERIQAGVYILIYTLIASLPLLISLLILSNANFNANFLILIRVCKNNLLHYFIAFMLILAFSVKLPLYLVHLWLPKAHVEAPVAGSMVLAAILLKLGGYGILRVSSKIHCLYYYISPFILSWSLSGGVLIALICVFQSDIKFLIALSSVAHISLVLASLLTFASWGINGAQFIIIGHGFCSSGLFFIANTIYERINSRSFFLIKGLQTIIPSITLIWFLLCTSNIAAPPSLNLLGESRRISSISRWSFNLIPLLIMLVFLAAAYSLFLYRQTQHGKIFSPAQPVKPTSTREWLTAVSHWTPLNLIIIAPWTIQIILFWNNLYKILSCGLKNSHIFDNFNITF